MKQFKKVDFEPHQGTTFEVKVSDDASVMLELCEIDGSEILSINSFSLIFKGPLRPIFRHATYPVRHSVLGAFELFLGPIQSDCTDGITYQAVFNS